MITELNIRSFLELSQTLNFTSAAENLYMTQQNVSKQIANLEKALDVTLFVRSRRRVSLTEEGKLFLKLFREFEIKFSDCVKDARKSQRSRSSSLLIGYMNWVYYGAAPHKADHVMSKLIPGYVFSAEMHPPAKLLNLLDDGVVDLILLYKRLAGNLERYGYSELKEIDVMIMASSKHARSIDAAEPSYFASEPLIVDADEQKLKNYTPDSEELRKFSIAPREILVCPNKDSVYLSIELGRGITLGSSISQIENRSINMYPTGCKDSLICIWRGGDNREIVETYVKCLREGFRPD